VALSMVLVAVLGTPLAVQHRTNLNLEAEIASLRQQSELVEPLRTENSLLAALQNDPTETERLRRENAEVHQLRGEVALLRRQQEEVERMAAQNAEMRAELTRMAQEMAAAVEAQAQRTPEQAQEFKLGIDLLNYSKNWMLAIYLYAQEHDGLVPTGFADALPYFQDPGIEGLSPENFEIVYSGKLDAATEPARTIVLREREPRLTAEGKWTRTYAFADGHCEIRNQDTDDFTGWEAERLVPARAEGPCWRMPPS